MRAVFRLRVQMDERRAGDLRPGARIEPGVAMNTCRGSEAHDLVPRRMERHGVDPLAPRVVVRELRRMAVGGVAKRKPDAELELAESLP